MDKGASSSSLLFHEALGELDVDLLDLIFAEAIESELDASDLRLGGDETSLPVVQGDGEKNGEQVDHCDLHCWPQVRGQLAGDN